MDEQKNKDIVSTKKNPLREAPEKEIDLMVLLYKLWTQRRVILIWCIWGVITGLVIAFSIPREYTTSISLAPEYRRRTNLTGGLGALASLAGISTSGNSGYDAVYPQLYPDIVSTVPFAMSLLSVPVKNSEGKEFTIEEYLSDQTSNPWWNVILSLPSKTVGLLGGKEQPLTFEIAGDSTLGPLNKTFKLTKKEAALIGMLIERVKADIDPNTYVITLKTKMQDPMVSAILADTAVARLRDYVTEYRTDKAKKDLKYAQQLNDEAKEEYYRSQKELADYIDKNQNLATRSANITRERLENESSLAFNLYNETALQLQNAKSKVQETTPVYTILSPATVPLKPSAPRKGLIIGGCTFLAFVVCCAWILFGHPIINDYKNKVEEIKNTNK